MKKLVLIITALFFSMSVKGQYTTFQNAHEPRSTSSFGMGLHNFAIPETEGAFSFNPAKLIYTSKTSISFFRKPFNNNGIKVPLESFSASYKLNERTGLGFEYANTEYLEDIRENILSVGGAYRFSSEFVAGALLRYGWMNTEAEIITKDYPYGTGEKVDISKNMISLSLGLLYQPDYLNKKVTLGFSIMDLTDYVRFESPIIEEKLSAPTSFNLGLYAEPFCMEYAILGFQAGFSKFLIDGDYERTDVLKHKAKSSFEALFSSWDEFPEDASSTLGLKYGIKPINLGNGVLFETDYYLGYFHTGIKGFAGWRTNYTHGMDIGINVKGIKFSAGLASIWYTGPSITYAYIYPQFITNGFYKYPEETFYFKLSTENDLFKGKLFSSNSGGNTNLILSGGVGYGLKTGKNSSYSSEARVDINSDNSLFYELSLIMKVSDKLAFEPRLQYTIYNINEKYIGAERKIAEMNNFSFILATRYYPLDKFAYVSTGAGIVRKNPVEKNAKYKYQPLFTLGTGYELFLNEKVVLMPELNYTLNLDYFGNSNPRVGGFSSVDFMIKAGYRF